MTADAHDTTIVGEAEHRATLERLLGVLGVPADQAVVVADNLVEADLRGVDSHGAHLMSLYDGRVRSGHITPVTMVTTLDDQGTTARLDGGRGFGQIAGVAAIDLAVERARTYGMATVSVRELTHLGALGYYTMRASAQGCFAMAFQNGGTVVPPFGGTTSLFSTNPFSYAVPAGGQPDIVYDVATTAAAGNKILLARKRGDASIPEGWANDEHGVPTTDPQAASIRQLQWFGGHKGFGIGLLVEIMSGLLADSSFGANGELGVRAHRLRARDQGRQLRRARRQPLPPARPVPSPGRPVDRRRARVRAGAGDRADLRPGRDRGGAPGTAAP